MLYYLLKIISNIGEHVEMKSQNSFVYFVYAGGAWQVW